MKKLLSIVLSALILCSAFAVIPAFAADGGYKKNDVVKLSFTAEDIDRSFTGMEGSLSFGSTVSINKDTVKFPHIGGVYYDVTDKAVLFNSTSLENYDISSDKVIVTAEFTVNEDMATLPIEAQLDDVYYVDGKTFKDFDKITLPYKLKMYVGDAPAAETTPAEETTAPGETTASETAEGATTAPVTNPESGETATAPVTESAPDETGTSTNPGSGDTKPTDAAETTAPQSTGATSATGAEGTTAAPENTETTQPASATVPATEATEATAVEPSEDTATTITLKKSKVTVYVKKTFKVGAAVNNPVGKTTYKSSKSKIAKVSASGKVTALKKGTAYITVTNNGVSKKLKVTVKNPKLNKKKLTLKVGQITKLKVVGKVGKAVFTSGDKKVVVINKSTGKLKAKGTGKAVITVKTNGKIKLKCKITVK